MNDTGIGSLDIGMSIDVMRATEAAAIAAARLRGRGDEKAADQAAVDAMRAALGTMPIDGTIVIGEGERDEAPMLFIGERVGTGRGPAVDIALDPLEGSTVCAKNLPDSLTVIALAAKGSLLNAPDVYMEKIAIGPGYPAGIVSLRQSATANLEALARAKGVPIGEVTACILDRPRHATLVAEIRACGAAIRLIGDGDVAGVIHTSDSAGTGIDIYMGIGGAPEGVLAAAALRCTGGQMEGRLQLNTNDKRARAEAMGVTDPYRIYALDDLVSGDVIFSATGVTGGSLLDGVRFRKDRIETNTLVMSSFSRTVHNIRSRHHDPKRFGA